MARRSHPVTNERNRGIVLPGILWITMLTIVVAVNYASAVQLSTRTTDNLKSSSLARHDAVSGVYVAIDRLLSEPANEDATYRLELNGNLVEVEVRLESKKAGLNEKSADELRDAFVKAGAEPDTARVLAARVIDWRDRDHNPVADGMEDADYSGANKPYGAKDSRIEDLVELLLMADLDRHLFHSLQDHVTVYSSGIRRLYSLTARTRHADGRQLYVTSAIVQITRQRGNPYRILKWQHQNG